MSGLQINELDRPPLGKHKANGAVERAVSRFGLSRNRDYCYRIKTGLLILWHYGMYVMVAADRVNAHSPLRCYPV